MSLLQSFHLAHLPQTHCVHVGLFNEVSNATFLRQQLLDANPLFEYAFISASSLISATHLFAAIYRAVNDQLSHRLKSRNVHSEIVFSLSPNNNIADAFRRFGIGPDTKDLCVVRVGGDAAAVATHLTENVRGTSVEFSDEALRNMTDWTAVRKVYKLGKAPTEPLDSLHVKEMETTIMGIMALKGS